MDFQRLKDFLTEHMRMSHVYQPAMLLTLLEHGGEASVDDIARTLLSYDQSQVEYYAHITKSMPGRVLSEHQVVVPQKAGRRITGYQLPGFHQLHATQIEELAALCRAKITDYIARRGAALWDHRRASEGYISGTLRYEVLKRAGLHCELCGISGQDKALQVDHIVPRSKGGSDELSNLQALCYSCNAMKRDHDDTDFHALRESFEHHDSGCLFCTLPPERVVDENALAYVIRDGFPVTPLHSLIIPKRHVATYFELTQSEINATTELLKKTQAVIRQSDSTVEGFNIGMNNGEAAGQTVFHCHIHLIPRRVGDVENPRGGVRHLIPGKGFY